MPVGPIHHGESLSKLQPVEASLVQISHIFSGRFAPKAVIHTRIQSPFFAKLSRAAASQQDSQHHPAQNTAVSTASWKLSRKVGSS
jgi:hypothetical protein